jgi:hypothetical protein
MGASKHKLILALALLIIPFLLFAPSPQLRRSLVKAPFRAPLLPGDLLPLLPWPVAQPLIRRLALRSPADLLPAFVAAARAPEDGGGGEAAQWKGACFYENRAWVEFRNGANGSLGGGVLHVEVSA